MFLRAIINFHQLSQLRQTGALQKVATQEIKSETQEIQQNFQSFNPKTEFQTKNGFSSYQKSSEVIDRDQASSQMSNDSADSMTSMTSNATINSSARGWSSSFSSNFQRNNSQESLNIFVIFH